MKCKITCRLFAIIYKMRFLKFRIKLIGNAYLASHKIIKCKIENKILYSAKSKNW